ncbi:MAG: PhzF family phenazine biosynthesis protein [Candidatus Dadabacteria bacterium]|nr:PhzF family phenazine biosynthesis protein [Candidatus Dadabacteria bacterium]MYC40305.1 PhzF family phenazine biosynthesis protein [Candidatus Dadabacteria bacterium]
MRVYIVDAFTDGPDSGNPAAVSILEEEIPDRAKQKIASEVNLSETAFLLEKDGVFELRWFTPETEVDLCGHATLASAHIIFTLGIIPATEDAVFSTKSGVLTARRKNDLVEMDFPSEDPWEVGMPKDLLIAISSAPLYVGRNRFDYIALYENEETIRNAVPELNHVKKLDSRGLIITSISSSDRYDFVSRFFAPNAGIDEDPVTGSAHCCLCPFWSRRLGKKELAGYQASERGGLVHTRLLEKRVCLSGKATVTGNFEIDPAS